MTKRVLRIAILGAVCGCLMATGAAVAVAGPVVVQNVTGDLNTVSLNGTATLSLVGSANDEYNNMGWSSVDGNLYALDLFGTGFNPGNTGLIRINPADGSITSLGVPMGLPTMNASRFDAGDVHGNTMWIHFGASVNNVSAVNSDTLFVLDLSAVTGGGNDISGTSVSTVGITGDDAQVNDWAYNPVDELLYGGDSLTGMLATLDPVTGVRTLFSVTGLLSGTAYGAAWYDPTVGDVFLYNNGGTIFQIDPTTKTVVESRTAPATTRNDGAYVGAVDVPEPASFALFGIGLAGLGFARRKGVI